MPSVERIRDAIAESRPHEPLPAQLAEQLAAIATLNDLTTLDVLLWLQVAPSPLTAAAFATWAAIHGLMPETTSQRIADYARQAHRCGLVRPTQLARATGMTPDAMRQILTGTGPVSIDVAAAIAHAIGIDPRDLYTLDEWRELTA